MMKKKGELKCNTYRCPFKATNPNSPDRVAIMGRLSEIGLIDWEIGERGKTIYKLNQKMYEYLKQKPKVARIKN